jgi:hypothetical protein
VDAHNGMESGRISQLEFLQFAAGKLHHVRVPAVFAAGLSAKRPFDPRSTTRRFTYYANNVGQMVSLPRLVASPLAAVSEWRSERT